MTNPSTRPRLSYQMPGVAAIAVGFVAVFVLSLGTDQLLHMAGVYPPWRQPMYSGSLNALALSYRLVYGVLGSYLMVRLSVHTPFKYMWIGAAIGFALSCLGVYAAMTSAIGPLWYPITLAFSAFVTAWIAGQIFRSRHPGY